MSRYQELLSIYLDGEPDPSELDELEQLLRDDPDLVRDFREQLIAWEAWSQEVTPERSSSAFLEAIQMRIHAESDAVEFSESTRKLIWKTRIKLFIRPILALAALIAIAFVYTVFDRDKSVNLNEASVIPIFQTVSLKGECVCTKCTLHQEGMHNKAIRFANASGETQILMLKKDPEMRKHTGQFCGGPTSVFVNGETIEEEGQALLAVNSIEFDDKLL